MDRALLWLCLSCCFSQFVFSCLSSDLLGQSVSSVAPLGLSNGNEPQDPKPTPDQENEPNDSDYRNDDEYAQATADLAARKQEYGERTIDNSRAFLRSQTPLLKPGKWQLDTGLSYTILESDLPTISGNTLTKAHVNFRSLETPFGFRLGVTERLQFFGSSSISWQSTETGDGFTQSANDKAGIGDVLSGFNFLLRQETNCTPSIITSWDVSAPTGNARDPRVLLDAGTGLGAWTASSRILMVKSLDPVVVFWGAGYRWTFEDTYVGDRIDLGDQAQYTFGIGFGVNDKVTLSSALVGAYITDLHVNSIRVPASAGDVISIRLASTIAQCSRIVEPFTTFGLTDRAPNATVGIVWTR
jgi:Putative MetA-pathway of phenol degradation